MSIQFSPYANRAFRYGDGLFETMKMVDGKILFLNQHLSRLLKGMQILKLHFVNEEIKFLEEEMIQVAKKNNHSDSCKVRLQVYRDGVGEGYVPETNQAAYIIETTKLESKNYSFKHDGITLGIYPELRKPQNVLSNLKTCNGLYSVLASIYAKEQQWDDCLLFNESGFLAEAVSSNLFIIKDKVFYTPSLDQGCLDGIMRAHVIEHLKKNHFTIIEKPLSLNDVKNADEVFLTNVIKGILAVSCLGECLYDKTLSFSIFNNIFNVLP